ncbi:MAG TPA: FUSC family protein [Ktedonobacteraceae bacterium]
MDQVDRGKVGTARRWTRSAWLRLRAPRDPGRMGLRRAGRAALVMPAAFAFAQFVIGNGQLTLFVAFGCFALLVMADFGGLRGPRALAYAAATGIGAVLIALGTLASASPWVGALVMLFVGMAITFAGVFGSYASAAQTALLLVFVLAVSVPAPPTALAPRLVGWLIAGAVSLLAGVFLWPRFEQVALHRQAASACRALATLIKARRSRAASPALAQAQVQEAAAAAEVAVSAVRQAYATTPMRPAGPARRDRAFVELLSELERIVEFAARPLSQQLDEGAHHPCLLEGDRLAAAVVETLVASAEVLTDGGAPPDLRALQAMLSTHRAALDQWAAQALRTGTAPEEVLDGLEADDTLRVVASLTLALGSNAVLAAGVRMDAGVETGATTEDVPTEIPLRAGVAGFLQRVGQTIRSQLAPTSLVLHTSLRVGLGLALAVLIAQLFQLNHAFWVVLGTMSALRSNALATGRTTLQALAGTLIGFAIGALFLVVVGTGTSVLWVILPVAVFLAAYAASAIGFVAGQAAFTVYILILFNLITPVGWQLGIVRMEDVALGAGISVVVGVLLWPRGARGELRVTLAGLYQAVAACLDEVFGRILEPGTAEASMHVPGRRGDGTLGGVFTARERAGEALDQYLRERGAKPLAPEDAGALVAAGADALLAAELLEQLAEMGYQAHAQAADSEGGDGVTALIGQVQALVATYVRLADQLDDSAATAAHASDRQGGISPAVSPEAVRASALSSLLRWRQDPEAGRAAITVVVAGEWVEHLGALAVALEKPVAQVAAAARVPWWR